MKLVILRTDPILVADLEVSNPFEVAVAFDNDDELEIYERVWAKIYKTDIVMWVEE